MNYYYDESFPTFRHETMADGKSIWRLDDGHGGHAEEHRQEMIEIATTIATKIVNDALSAIIDQKIDDAIDKALERRANDLDTVNASFDINIHSAIQSELDGVFKQFFHKELAAIFKKNGLTLKIR